MDKLEREKMMVKGMISSGMTLAEVARELEMNKSTVYTRYNDLYAPAKAREKVSKKEELENSIKKDEERIVELEKENIVIDEELNCPANRSDEDLVEYREKRDKDVQIAGAVPKFD